MAESRPPPRRVEYDVLAKWRTLSFDDVTRAVIEPRLHAPPPRRFLAPEPFQVLEAACARLLATRLGEPPIAHWIDADLFEGRDDEGFRHPDMPWAREAWGLGLNGLGLEARHRHGGGFAALDGPRQDDVLHAVQHGRVQPRHFEGVDARRFFIDVLLKTAVGHYYSQPQAWSEIGFGGPASPRGYVRIGLDRRDPWEAPFDTGRGHSP
jgi:hypothetical protein